VSSIDWNGRQAPFIGVGLANGNVASFDIRNYNSSLCMSEINFESIHGSGGLVGQNKGKHVDIVWSCVWEKDMFILIFFNFIFIFLKTSINLHIN
jgi:hypothetical protein